MSQTRKIKRFKDMGIDITILKQGIPSKKVLSVSFYTMKDAYRIKEKYETKFRRN